MVSSSTTNVTYASGRSLVSINGTQFSLKLTATNYSTWRAQVFLLLKRHSLMGYVMERKQIPNPNYEYWECQNQLILATLRSLLSFSVMNVVANIETFAEQLIIIIAAIHAHDTVISFDELQDKLLAHELYLKQINLSYEVAPITAIHV
ncbi:hypothetical protein MANES_12G065476v8 [Manihot esculenta]|uniref:Uncharacterized protein n=1 Tax=Manihot esculenta TaxID=3983 RepID=A0ACB7GP97_MANES|nr:hypothetical protein MANES_12G065476v8 [Manihot esculenta]